MNDYHKYMKWCNDRNITIYPVPIREGKYHIVINTNGKENRGIEVYEDKISYKIAEGKNGKNENQKIKIEIPSVSDKIRSLYKEVYKINFKKE